MQTPALDALGVRDLRTQLPTDPANRIGRRDLAGITSLTLHYSGKAVATDITNDAAVLRVLTREAQYHIDKNWQTDPRQPPIHGDGLMYTFTVLPSGAIVQCRDLDAYLYHCGSAEGNPKSIAIHFVIGGSQQPTVAQWTAFGALCDALISDFKLAGRQTVKAHLEWKATDCPGPVLWPMLKAWRSEAPTAPVEVLTEETTLLTPQRFFRTRWAANYVRQGPGRTYDIALSVPAGIVFIADAIKTGQRIDGSNVWYHNRDGSGFAHASVVQAIDYHPTQLCFIGDPTISVARWTDVLEQAQSPALIADPATLYHIPISYRINPAIALAFFLHESSLGKKGITFTYNTKNWGNARSAMEGSRAHILTIPDRGNFAAFETWEDGLDDWCRRILYKYCGLWGRYTVEQATPKYAPASDNNNPAVYAATVAKHVVAWRS